VNPAEPLQIQDLQATGVYIAGALDTAILEREDLFDVILTVAVPASSGANSVLDVGAPTTGSRGYAFTATVSVTKHAANELRMCSIHRELAEVILSAAKKHGPDQLPALLESIASPTRKILSLVHAMIPEATTVDSGTVPRLSEEIIASKIPNEANRKWLVRLATAEGLL
jgi:hypothetical protein